MFKKKKKTHLTLLAVLTLIISKSIHIMNLAAKFDGTLSLFTLFIFYCEENDGIHAERAAYLTNWLNTLICCQFYFNYYVYSFWIMMITCISFSYHELSFMDKSACSVIMLGQVPWCNAPLQALMRTNKKNQILFLNTLYWITEHFIIL